MSKKNNLIYLPRIYTFISIASFLSYIINHSYNGYWIYIGITMIFMLVGSLISMILINKYDIDLSESTSKFIATLILSITAIFIAFILFFNYLPYSHYLLVFIFIFIPIIALIISFMIYSKKSMDFKKKFVLILINPLLYYVIFIICFTIKIFI